MILPLGMLSPCLDHINSLTSMLYWTSWPDNTDAVVVQLDKMIINALLGGLIVVYWTGV